MFLRVQNLKFSYPDNPDKNIINDISFDLEKGKTLVIVGASGAGKSTLLRLIAGILPTHQILINEGSTQEYLEEKKLGFMFQAPTLFPNLTVKENIELPTKITNAKSSVDSLVQTVGLKEYQNYLPSKLSGGMKTRVSLARSFVTNPELLLLDEPFSSLDVAWKDVLYYELKQLVSRSNTTVVLVTHDIEEAIKLGDKIICLGIEGGIILEKNNTDEEGIYSEIQAAIIANHRLRKEYEKKS